MVDDMELSPAPVPQLRHGDLCHLRKRGVQDHPVPDANASVFLNMPLFSLGQAIDAGRSIEEGSDADAQFAAESGDQVEVRT